MARRTVEDIRAEIASERAALREDVDALEQTLRARLPFVIAGLVTAVLASIGLVLAIKKLRRH
jgi:hypothetical protein